MTKALPGTREIIVDKTVFYLPSQSFHFNRDTKNLEKPRRKAERKKVKKSSEKIMKNIGNF